MLGDPPLGISCKAPVRDPWQTPLARHRARLNSPALASSRARCPLQHPPSAALAALTPWPAAIHLVESFHVVVHIQRSLAGSTRVQLTLLRQDRGCVQSLWTRCSGAQRRPLPHWSAMTAPRLAICLCAETLISRTSVMKNQRMHNVSRFRRRKTQQLRPVYILNHSGPY